MLRKLSTFIFAVLLLTNGYSQDLAGKISQDALAILSFNFESYGKKLDFSKIQQSTWFKEFDKNAASQTLESYEFISKIFKNPTEIGINLAPRSYGVAEFLKGDFYTISYFVGISDAKKFEKAVSKQLANSKTAKEKKIIKKDGNKIAMLNDFDGVIWNDKFASIIAIIGEDNRINFDISYGDSLYDQKMEKRRETFKEMKQTELKIKFDNFNITNDKSIENNPNFKLFQTKSYDVGCWLNMSKLTDIYVRQMATLMPNSAMTGLFSRLSVGSYQHAFLSFNQGDITLDTHDYPDEKLAKNLTNAYNERLNPEAFKYIKGNKILGFVSIASDLEVIAKVVDDYYRPILKEFEEGLKILAIYDLVSIPVDEKALLTLFKNGAIVAVTGTKEFQRTSNQYETDADGKESYVEKKVKEVLPIGAIVLTAGNKENVEKIINALKVFNLVKPSGKGYAVEIPNSSMVINFIMNGDVIVITNDETLDIEKGVSKDMQLAPAFQTMLANNSNVAYFDFPNIINASMDFSKEVLNDRYKKMFEAVKSALESFRGLGVQQDKNVFKQQYILSVKDKKRNAMQVLSDLIDTLNPKDEK